MTVAEVVREKAKPFADDCLSSPREYIVRRRWDAEENDGTEWLVSYFDDWPVRYMKASMNGQVYPVIAAYSNREEGRFGSCVFLRYGPETRKWYAIPVMIAGDIGTVYDDIKSIAEEWNEEEE